MGRIDELVAVQCPGGVPHERVSDVFSIVTTARGVKRSAYSKGARIPIVDQGKSLVAGHTDDMTLVVPEGDYVVFGDHTRAVKWVDFPFAVGADGTKVLQAEERLLPKFAYYAMTNLDIPDRGYNRHWTIVRAMLIPVPPREVQDEIVRILDSFSALTAELEAELEARRTQRSALLNNFAVTLRDHPQQQTGTETLTLGSIARESVLPVKIEPREKYASLGVKWKGEGVIARDPREGRSIKATTLYRARAGQLIYNRMFVVEGSFALVPDSCDHAVVSGEFPVFDLDTSRVDPYWLVEYLCDAHTLKRIEREVTGAERGSMKSRRRWKSDQFEKFELSLPSVEAQRKTVSTLQASDVLLQSLEQEIEARRKQDEYYRDRLLRFEEAAT